MSMVIIGGGALGGAGDYSHLNVLFRHGNMECMLPIQQKPIPAQRLKELGVGVVYLFGSQAEGFAGPSSDIDIGVVLIDPKHAQGSITELYNALYEIFTDVFDMSNFRTLDIVFLERVSLELRFDAISHGTVLFEASPEVRLDFEERTAALYRDFQPLLKEFNRAVLERV